MSCPLDDSTSASCLTSGCLSKREGGREDRRDDRREDRREGEKEGGRKKDEIEVLLIDGGRRDTYLVSYVKWEGGWIKSGIP